MKITPCWAALTGAAMLLNITTTTAIGAEEGRQPRPRPPQHGPARAALLERFDANRDGRLDEAERAAAREAMRATAGERRERARAEALGRFDTDGDGRLSDAERAAAREALLERAPKARREALARFDKDGDGKLSEAERTALREALKERAAQRRPQDGN